MAQNRRVSGVSTTVKREENGRLVVRYHWTDVVVVEPNGDIRLDTNGWRTATTKLRMNQAANQYGLGYTVWQKDFAWFVRWQGKDIEFSENTLTLKKG